MKFHGKLHKGKQPLNKTCLFAYATPSHPFYLRNSLIFDMRYMMVQKSNEVKEGHVFTHKSANCLY